MKAPGWLRITVIVCCLWLVSCSDDERNEEGFAGLAQSSPASTFQQPGPGDRIRLPEDWGAHPQHRIEWWYLTANLKTDTGKPLGIQWTQFRQGLNPRAQGEAAPAASDWPLQSAWMAHGAVSFDGRHHFSERFARGDVGQAGAQAQPFKVWLDHWQLRAVAPGEWQLNAAGEDWSYNLRLTPGERVVRHGDQGFSAKAGDGSGSMYFSLIDIGIAGTVTLEGRDYPVTGTGWLDREWSSQFLRSDQQGWDWFALRLDSGGRLMMFRVGRGEDAFVSGTWVDPAGSVHPLVGDQIVMKPLERRQAGAGQVPAAWRIQVPSRSLDLEVRAPPGDYWNRGLYPYWESPVTVTGSSDGEGYMELTGYGQP